MSLQTNDYRAVGKEYRNNTTLLYMALLSYFSLLLFLALSAVSGNWALMVLAAWFLPFGIASHVLHTKSGGSCYTVLEHTTDHAGNPMIKVQYRHGEIGYIPGGITQGSLFQKLSF